MSLANGCFANASLAAIAFICRDIFSGAHVGKTQGSAPLSHSISLLMQQLNDEEGYATSNMTLVMKVVRSAIAQQCGAVYTSLAQQCPLLLPLLLQLLLRLPSL